MWPAGICIDSGNDPGRELLTIDAHDAVLRPAAVIGRIVAFVGPDHACVRRPAELDGTHG